MTEHTGIQSGIVGCTLCNIYMCVCVHIHVCILIYVYMLISPYMLYNIKVVQQLYNIYGQISGSDDPPSL